MCIRPQAINRCTVKGGGVRCYKLLDASLTRGANDTQMANAMEDFPIHPEKKAVMHSLSVLASACLHTCSCMSGSFDLESFFLEVLIRSFCEKILKTQWREGLSHLAP